MRATRINESVDIGNVKGVTTSIRVLAQSLQLILHTIKLVILLSNFNLSIFLFILRCLRLVIILLVTFSGTRLGLPFPFILLIGTIILIFLINEAQPLKGFSRNLDLRLILQSLIIFLQITNLLFLVNKNFLNLRYFHLPLQFHLLKVQISRLDFLEQVLRSLLPELIFHLQFIYLLLLLQRRRLRLKLLLLQKRDIFEGFD